MTRSDGPAYFGAILISLVPLAIGCKSQPYDVVVHNRLMRVAGEDGADCGRATTDAQNEQHSNCALENLARKHPFIVQYRLQGIDAISEYGLALSPVGRLSTVSTFSWGPAAPVGRIDEADCDVKNIRQTAAHYLTCD